MCIFLEQKKRVKPCVVHNSFSAVLLQQKKKGRQIIQVFSVEERQPNNLFFGYIFQKGFLIQIRFRGQFSGEIFINLS